MGSLSLHLEGEDWEYPGVAPLSSILLSGLVPLADQITITLPGTSSSHLLHQCIQARSWLGLYFSIFSEGNPT